MMRPLKIGPSYVVEFSQDSAHLATLGRSVWMWGLQSRTRQWRSHPFPHPSYVVFSPDSATLAVKDTTGKIVVLKAADASVVVNFQDLGDGEGSNIVYSQQGDFLIDGSWSGYVSIRDVSSGATVFHRLFQGEMIRRIHSDQARQHWIIEHQPKVRQGGTYASSAYFTHWQWPFHHGTLAAVPTRFNRLHGSALSHDGSRLAVIDGESLQIRHLPDGELIVSAPVEIGGTGAALRWSPDGSILGSIQKKKIVLYRTHDMSIERSFSFDCPSDVAFSPKGGMIALGDWAAGLLVDGPPYDLT